MVTENLGEYDDDLWVPEDRDTDRAVGETPDQNYDITHLGDRQNYPNYPAKVGAGDEEYDDEADGDGDVGGRGGDGATDRINLTGGGPNGNEVLTSLKAYYNSDSYPHADVNIASGAPNKTEDASGINKATGKTSVEFNKTSKAAEVDRATQSSTSSSTRAQSTTTPNAVVKGGSLTNASSTTLLVGNTTTPKGSVTTSAGTSGAKPGVNNEKPSLSATSTQPNNSLSTSSATKINTTTSRTIGKSGAESSKTQSANSTGMSSSLPSLRGMPVLDDNLQKPCLEDILASRFCRC